MTRRLQFTLLTMGALLLLPWAIAARAETPGYAGTELCAECHEDTATDFAHSVHGRATLEDWSGVETCESCHGPGEAHVEEGDPELIRTFANLPASEANEACMTCHNGPEQAYWHGSEHQGQDMACTDCHGLHQPWTSDQALANKNSTEMCLSCHTDQRKSLHARSNHPLKYGQMSCDDCHNPHGSPIEANIDAQSVNEVCWGCHAETRGPFLWEHAPVRESCLTCHDAHSSNQTKLLVMAAPRLCQSCHLFGHHQTVPGLDDQAWNVNRSCVNCHPRIHGSNHPSGIVLMR